MGGTWLPLAAVVLLFGCAPTQPAAMPPAESGAGAVQARPSGTIRIAWGAEPSTLRTKFEQGGASAARELAVTFDSFLTNRDRSGAVVPELARQIPTVDNGDWVVRPDGTMTTVYRLRENARWHDGAPIDASDFVFAYTIYTDTELSVAKRAPENSISSVEAPDPHTVVINWKEPFFRANELGNEEMDPLPR
ncbi:MAG: extracellular solute-binding protein family 5, partial [Chloroflexi bacterium]|nr:extracellular solute-binding protein family 5 [Chloroflexota bacterium]